MRNVEGEEEKEKKTEQSERLGGISELGVNQLQHHLLSCGHTDNLQLFAAYSFSSRVNAK